MKRFSLWQEFDSWLNGLGMFHMQLGLERIKRGMRLLGLEAPRHVSAQVLGTNGKGSTCAFLASLASAHAIKAGLYTSPHFVSPRERIRVAGRMLSEAEWLDAANAIFSAYGGAPDLTYFEMLTLMALLMFRSSQVEVAIFEAGLGGRNDATSAIPAHVRCFAPIAMDHSAIIGPDIAHIASDKAAAIQRSDRVITAPQYPLVREILAARARGVGANLSEAAGLPPGMAPGMRGPWQAINAALAVAAWREAAPMLGIAPHDAKVASALTKAFIPGRLQRIAAGESLPGLLLDGAHNPHGMASLVREARGRKLGAIVFSCLGDKDWRSVAAILAGRLPAVPIFVMQLQNDRAASASAVAAFINQLAPGRARAFAPGASLAEIIPEAAAAGKGDILLTGSLFLLAEFFNLYPQYLEQSENESIKAV